MLLLSPAPASPRTWPSLRIFNPDGSEAELSGNGAREAILYLRRAAGPTRDALLDRHAGAGTIRPTITGPFSCRVDMGAGAPDLQGLPRRARPTGRGELARPAGRSWRFQPRLDRQPPVRDPRRGAAELAALDLPLVGPPIEAQRDFPNRTNVSWYTELDPGPPARIRARIFERGVGETLSSGTGASGAAVAYVLDAARRATSPAGGRA